MSVKSFILQITLKPHQLKLVQMMDILQHEKQKYPGVTFNICTAEITLSGPGLEIAAAQVNIYQAINGVESEKMSNYSKSACLLLQKPPIIAQIVDILKARAIKAVWEVRRQWELEIWAASKQEVNDCLDVIRQSIVEFEIPFSVEDNKVNLSEYMYTLSLY